MKSFAKYISKHLLSFIIFVIALFLINFFAFGVTFRSFIYHDYNDSPEAILSSISEEGLTENVHTLLNKNNVWVMFLNQDGSIAWSYSVPEEIPDHFKLSEIASFSKGYLKDYPVFVQTSEDGLLIIGYPKNSYAKFTTNYYPIHIVQLLPVYVVLTILINLLILFLAYFFSKNRILKRIDPIVSSISDLAKSKPVSLPVNGDLCDICISLNQASAVISRQNIARANWISGVSHDIRTPLSMILGYSEGILADPELSDSAKEKTEIIKNQSLRLKDLVQDLNLVSQLDYEMQPLQKTDISPARLLRSLTADLINSGILEQSGQAVYSIDLNISENVELITYNCDSRLLTRALSNLVNNSIRHNPDGCHILLSVEILEHELIFSVSDDGVGFTPEKLADLKNCSHYMISTDEKLNLRHGLGLMIVDQVVKAHSGKMDIISTPDQGCTVSLHLPM